MLPNNETTPVEDLPPSGKHIIKFKHGTFGNHPNWFPTDKISDHWEGFDSVAGVFDDATLDWLRLHPDIEAIVPDSIVMIDTIQNNAPWGLGRLSGPKTHFVQPDPPNQLVFTYTFDGRVTDVYVVDTGIYLEHHDFGGRARWGKTFAKDPKTGKLLPDVDGHGHGTHVAGTIGGTKYGVDKYASLIAVKVLNNHGQGNTSDMISGMNWIKGQIANSDHHTIISMSLHTKKPSQIFDGIVDSLAEQGVHLVASAGNKGMDANSQTPARAAGAVTVGASTSGDAFASWSNRGPCVDIIAPGDNVISAWIGSPDNWMMLFGTSQACPHVSGLISYLIRIEGYKTPAQMREELRNRAAKDVLLGVPKDTVNLLAHNDIVMG